MPRFRSRLITIAAELIFSPLRLFNFWRKSYDVKNILVVEVWGIGDVVLATGAISSIRSHWPESQIDVLARPHAEELMRDHPANVNVVKIELPWVVSLNNKYRVWRWPWRQLISDIKELRSRKYDLVVDGRADVRNHILTCLIAGARSVGLSYGLGLLQTDSLAYPSIPSHRVDNWKSLTDHLGIELPVIRPNLFVSDEEKVAMAKTLSLEPDGWISFHLGARNSVRTWPLERSEELIKRWSERAGETPLILIQEPDGASGEINLPSNVLSVSNLSLREMMAVVANSRTLFCMDSGPMHIAVGLGIQVVSLFGPMDPVYFGPIGDEHIVIHKDVCEYRPCYDNCHFSSAKCMEAITVDDVDKNWPGIYSLNEV